MTQQIVPNTEGIIRAKELKAFTGLCLDSINKLEALGKFPKRRKLSVRAMGWRRADVIEWTRNPERWGLN